MSQETLCIMTQFATTTAKVLPVFSIDNKLTEFSLLSGEHGAVTNSCNCMTGSLCGQLMTNQTELTHQLKMFEVQGQM